MDLLFPTQSGWSVEIKAYKTRFIFSTSYCSGKLFYVAGSPGGDENNS